VLAADSRDAAGFTARETIAATPPQQVSPEQQARSASSEYVVRLEAEVTSLRDRLALANFDSSTADLNDERVLQSVGIYRYHHPMESAAAYRDKLEDITARIAETVKSDRAVHASNLFTFDNSLTKGRRMSKDLGTLMLRAYNSEVENALRTMRAGNVATAKRRVEASRAAIARLGSMMELHITDEYHALRLEELELTADFLMKRQEEQEAAREERARIREEKRVAEELAREREQLDKERAHITNALVSLREAGDVSTDLEDRLEAIERAIAQNDFRAANIRAGYVYVISNRGSFGEGVVKIGLTRRLTPSERIDELSDASVPFNFDTHCLFFTEDAVTLENELHSHFAGRRLNIANPRKEFFFATPEEVRQVLQSKVGSLLEFQASIEATEFFQSVSSWPRDRAAP